MDDFDEIGEEDTAGTVASSAGPQTVEIPTPIFARRHMRGLHRSSRMVTGGGTQEVESWGTADSSSRGTEPEDQSMQQLMNGQALSTSGTSSSLSKTSSVATLGWKDHTTSGTQASATSPMDDPWVKRDPWQVAVAENWSSTGSEDGKKSENQWSGSSWSDRASWRENDGYNWQGHGDWQSGDQWEASSDYSSTSRSSMSSKSSWWSAQSWKEDRRDYDYECRNWEIEPLWERSQYSPQAWEKGEGWSEGEVAWEKGNSQSQESYQMNGATVMPTSPTSHVPNDPLNRPTGSVPSGQPSVAGGSGGSQPFGAAGPKENGSGKISSTYPPIFYARPGESWEDYWRSVMFWLASEGKSIPAEMRGPRLMQQLRERAAKIVQHLSVDQVSSASGIDIIRKEMERSPIIRILDNKKIDKRRQKFMKLARLPQESMESFINRAEIYRRENESSPAYSVGSCFYVGHLLDSAKLTRKDLALLKAACGVNLEDEAKVVVSLLELSEQLEGQPHCPIGRGEPQLDNEDKYLVQKHTSSSSSTTASSPDKPSHRRFQRGRGGRFSRRRFRDALVAILEEDDQGEDNDTVGSDSMDEEDGVGRVATEKEDDMTEFASNEGNAESVLSGQNEALAEIFAQEYKARNRVRKIKKMRQYFQRDHPGGPSGARSEHVKKWVAEQQKTEPCFICHQLGHWSQECPFRGKKDKAPFAANVTFPVSQPQQEDWALLESAAGVYMVSSGQGSTGTSSSSSSNPHTI